MLKSLRNTGLGAVLLTATSMATAQMVVHAVSGTVKSIDQKTKRMNVAIEEGSNGSFALQSKSDVKLDFDSDLRGDAVDATKFSGVDDFAVIYFYGFGDKRTAVAIKDLGSSNLEKTLGKVADLDKKSRKLSVQKSDGTSEEFELSDTAVVDTGMGLESGRKYNPRKGAAVRVTSSVQDGKKVAVFVRSRR